jgi:hypothetical protein
MARYSAGMTAAGAGTTLRPVFAILSTATVSPILRAVNFFNTTATACTYRLVNFTGGTAGAGQTERKYRRNGPTAICTTFGLWTADATIGEDTGYRAVIGAGAGNGAMITFGAEGLEAELGATSGLGLVPVGTGQICEISFEWDE